MFNWKAIGKTYGRAVLAAVGAVVATGNTDIQDILKAAVAALMPVVVKWLDKSETAFGPTYPVKRKKK